MLRILLKHLAGKHNQKLHGRAGRGDISASPIDALQAEVEAMQFRSAAIDSQLGSMQANRFGHIVGLSVEQLDRSIQNMKANGADEDQIAIVRNIAELKAESNALNDNLAQTRAKLLDLQIKAGLPEAALNDVRVKRDAAQQKLQAAAEAAHLGPKYSDSDIRFIVDTSPLPEVRQAAMAVLSARMELASASTMVDNATEQYVIGKIQAGTMPIYNTAELYKQQYANRNSPEKLAVINNQLQESRYASMVAQRNDGKDHNAITRSNIALTDYEAMFAKLDGIDDMQHSGRNESGTFHSDLIHDHINKQLGLDAPPKLLNRAEMDAMVVAGAVEMFRGVQSDGMERRSAGQLTDQFMRGELFAGTGVFGNGTYVGYGVERAAANAYSDVSEGQGVLRMALKPAAKVVNITDLYRQVGEVRGQVQDAMSARAESLEKQIASQLSAGASESSVAALRQQSNTTVDIVKSYQTVLGDVGRFAALAGYDAIDNNDGFMVVLNRSAVMADINLYNRVQDAK